MFLPQSFRKVSILFSYLFILLGTASIIGWLANITFLKSIFEGWVTLKINTAIWLILSGIVLILWNKSRKNKWKEGLISMFSSIVFIMSFLTILEYLFNFSIGIDELLMKGEVNEIGNKNPGRPIPLSALSFLLFSFTFLPGVRKYGKPFFIQSIYLLIGVISFISGTGYMIGFGGEEFSPAFAYLSIYTGVSFFIMMAAGLFSRPHEGIMKQISSDTIGGSLFRKTFFFFIPGLVILGWVRVLGEQSGWYAPELSKIVVVIIAMISFALILYLSSSSLTKSEYQINKKEEQLREREELFSTVFHSKIFGLAIVDKERRIVDINETLTNLIGFTREDFIGKTTKEMGFTNPEYIRKRDKLLVLIKKQGRLEDYELDIITRHGKPMSFLLSVEPLKLNQEHHWLIYLKDITEKRNAERKLEESESRLRSILETVPECVKIIDDNGELTYMNPAGLAMVEADSFEMVKGRKGLSNINETYLKEFYQLITKVFSGSSSKMEYEITGFKGSKRWMETNAVPLIRVNDKITSILSVTRDITEKKIAETKIIESEEKYRTLVEQADDAIFIINNQGRLVTTNQSGCRLSGYTMEELEKVTIYDVVFEDDLRRDPFHFDELAKGNTVRNERRVKKKGGISIEVEITAKMLANGDIFIFCRDISERKKSEELLRESEERLSRAEKMGNLGYGYFDIENNKMQLSAGLYKIFGVKPENFSHTIEGLKSVIHPGDFLIQDKAVDTLFINGKVDVAFRIVRPDGAVRNVLFKTVLTRNNNGDLVSSFTTAVDTTESKKAEEQIKENNLQLRQLAANLQNIREEERRRIGREIHDELGQWLTVLKMEISRVKKIKNDENRLNEAIEEMLNQVDECIRSSRRISTELRPTIIDDLGLIAALEWQAEEFGRRSKIRSVFKTDIENLDLPPDFTIAIFRIFQESLTNIARHAEATNVTTNIFVSDGNLYVNISDNGKGFDTRTIGSKKTLGLIGMKERTLLMEGTYNISSILGKGTDIAVVIPLPVG